VLLALSFPRYGHPAVAFVALAPLLVAVSGWAGRAALPGVSTRRGFALGLLAGFLHFAGTMYWTSATVSTFGGLPVVVAALIAGLLALYLATFPAIAMAIVSILVRRFGVAGLWLAPAAWVTLEYVRSLVIEGGVPWSPLGNTMVTFLPIAQLASAVGVFGLTVFVVLLNVGFALTAMLDGRRRYVAAAVSIGLIAATSVWGGLRLSSNALTSGTPIKIGLIQGNIAQTDKWDPTRAGMILSRYLQLTRQAAANGAQFIIWPESSTPFPFEEDRAGLAVRHLVQALGKPLLLGSDEFEEGKPPSHYNSAFMLDTAGATAAVHRKIQLVPFGEYVPFKPLLPFIGPLVQAASGFSPGTRVTMLPVEGHMISTAICFEVAFPTLAREAVQNGSEMLTTVTNDAWYGQSSAPYQHFELAAMRSIEQGRYLARAANTGFSGIIDPYGRVLIKTNLFETVAVVGEARFVQAKTLYARIGDVVVFMSAAVIALALGLALRKSRGSRP
jgi:apolipoprotein N-acyltransferase